MAITFSDISQWQPTFDPAAYLAAGHTIIILRALSKDDGPDKMMPERRDQVREHDFTAVGYYNRLNASRDPADQAREFIKIVGDLRDNEFPILDHEDGTGNQTPRAEAWFEIVDDWAGFQATLYSGAYFLNDNLSGVGHWGTRPLWIADYTENGKPNADERPPGSDWWQFSSTHHFPGLPGQVDANSYPNSPQQFLELVRAGAPPTGDDIMAITAALNENGSLHVFVEAKDGTVWYTYQPKDKNSWNGGEAGQKVAGLNRFAPAPGKDKY